MKERARVSAVFLPFGLSVLLCVSVTLNWNPGTLILFATFVAAATTLLRHAETRGHPGTICGLIVGSYGALGFLIYPSIFRDGQIPYLYRFLESEYTDNLYPYILAALLFMAPPLLGSFLRLGRAMEPSWDSVKDIVPTSALRLGVSTAGVSLLAYCLGISLPSLFLRTSYQDFSSSLPLMQKVGASMSLPMAIVCIFAIFDKRLPNRRRLFASAVLAGFVVIGFGTSSRELAIYPVVFIMVIWVLRGRRSGFLAGLMGLPLSIFLASRAISLRLGSEHGVIPYAGRFFELAGEGTIAGQFREVLAVSLAGYPNAAFIVNRAPDLGWREYFASIDPRPSFLTGYESLSSGLTVVPYIPYSSIGMLAAMGWLTLTLHLSLVSFALHLLWRFAGASSSQLAPLVNLGLAAGSVLFSLLLLQYPLRNSTRMLELLALLSVTCLLLTASAPNRKRAIVDRFRFEDSSSPAATKLNSASRGHDS